MTLPPTRIPLLFVIAREGMHHASTDLCYMDKKDEWPDTSTSRLTREAVLLNRRIRLALRASCAPHRWSAWLLNQKPGVRIGCLSLSGPCPAHATMPTVPRGDPNGIAVLDVLEYVGAEMLEFSAPWDCSLGDDASRHRTQLMDARLGERRAMVVAGATDKSLALSGHSAENWSSQ